MVQKRRSQMRCSLSTLSPETPGRHPPAGTAGAGKQSGLQRPRPPQGEARTSPALPASAPLPRRRPDSRPAGRRRRARCALAGTSEAGCRRGPRPDGSEARGREARAGEARAGI